MDENKKTTETNSGTPFDDVFRTMVNDCKRLLLPVLNEMFHYSYEGDEEIEFLPTERYLHNLDDKSERRGSDSAFKVTGKDGYERNYIIECQSKPDNSMAVRILEYGIKFAIDNADKEKNKISIHIPNTGVFQLRSTKNTPDNIQVEIVAPQNNKLSYSVPVLKMRNYSLEEIFTKNLSFMLPFYMFNNASKLRRMSTKDFSKDILEDCGKIKDKLDKANLSTFERKSITKMFLQVMNALSNNDSAKALCKEAEKIMVGQVLQYEAKDILNEGIALGIKQGREQGIEQGIEQGVEQKNSQIKSTMYNYIKNQEFYPAYIVKRLDTDIPESDFDVSFMSDVVSVHGANGKMINEAVLAVTKFKGESTEFSVKLLDATLKSEQYREAFENEQDKTQENTR